MIDLSRMRILVVDDEPFMRLTIKQMLRALGARQVKEAADGQAALDLLAKFKADIVLCDIDMQPMNGLQFVQRMREGQDESLRLTSVVMLTVHSEEGTVKDAARLRISGYLVKPVSTAQLSARLEAAIAQKTVFRTVEPD